MFKKTLTSILLTLVWVGGFFVHIETNTNSTSVGNQELQISLSTPVVSAWSGADSTNTKETDEDSIRKLFNSMVALVNLIIDLLTMIVTPAIIFASWLISPDWTSGDLFELRPTFHSLWVLVSNVTYLVYAILLIFIALATIFNSEHYGYKAMLPKLALGIILVPLTWWGVQFVISLSTYITASVITIPQETMFQINKSKCASDDDQKCWENRPSIPKVYKFFENEALASISSNDNAWKNCPVDCVSPKEFFRGLWWTYWHLLVYAYSVFKVNDVKKIDTTWNKISTWVQLLHQWIIGAILFMVFGILILALCVMLFFRAVKLWFYAIFSPLFTLHYVTGWGIFGWEGKENFSIKEFIGLAFVPAIVWLALSFWLVVIGTIQSSSNSDPSKGNCTEANIKSEDANDLNSGCQIIWLFWNDANKVIKKAITMESNDVISLNQVLIWGVRIDFYGKVKWGTEKSLADDANNATWVLGWVGGIFWTLIVDILALIFIWVAFMAAKWVSKAVAAAIDPFEKMGQQIGKLGMSLPKYIPLPVPGGSIKWMEKSVELATSIPEHKFNESYKKSELGKKLSEMSWGSVEPKYMSRLNEANHAANNKETATQWRDVTQEMLRAGELNKITSETNKKYLLDLQNKKLSDWELTNAWYGTLEAKRLAEILKEEKSMESEWKRKIVAALLAWAKVSDVTNESAAQGYINNWKSTTNNTPNSRATVEVAGDKNWIIIQNSSWSPTTINIMNPAIPSEILEVSQVVQKITDFKSKDAQFVEKIKKDPAFKEQFKKELENSLGSIISDENKRKIYIDQIMSNLDK